MAFIRQYQARSAMGDPLFGIKLPKIKVGSLLGKVGTVASFVPGPIGIAGRVGKLAKVMTAGKALMKMGAAGAVIGAGSEVGSRLLGGGINLGPGFTGYGSAEMAKAMAGAGRSAGTTGSYDPVTGTRYRKRYRRMNVTNMKALTRASRRVHRFAKLARTVLVQSKSVRAPRKGARGRKA